ncbi:hypothetical protein NBRC116583_05050 [Arenicella sp. 4NH20-0111]|uniref:hypothetical protein n=1 Tax=Arenicella sp. 4NH20-0111 TaxID=3127648 RepID=UPI003103D488
MFNTDKCCDGEAVSLIASDIQINNLVTRNGFSFGKLLLSSLLLFFLISSLDVKAQSEQRRVAAVLTVVNTLLLEETNIDLEINEFDDTSREVSQSFTTGFRSPNRDVEYCFQLDANKAVTTSNLTLRINGVIQRGQNQPVLGENCYSIPLSQLQSENRIEISVKGGLVVTLNALGLESSNPTRLSLPVLTRSSWDQRAVRKVLKIFAFGGHATDAQIKTWADMRPNSAIAEMLNFNQHNLKLSPILRNEKYTEPATNHGTLTEFYDYIGSESSNIPIRPDQRQYLGIDGYRFASTFGRMIAMRGLNPFRQRIGFWETNYHLATNRNAGVSRRQMVAYYDAIMQAHEQRVPYHEVMGVAAKSAAVAMQYGHRRNQWVERWVDVDGDRIRKYILEGNHDFAREIHQLFFGIFGGDDPTHEDVTIDNTGKMLTDMRVPYIQDFGFDTKVTFETDDHHRDEFGPLRILGHNITGVDAAAKIDNLMPISISHPESLKNLPVYIINTLADDSLTEAKREQLRTAWARLGTNKDFLTFIRAYAVSEMFHGDDHSKFLTSYERAYYIANKFNIDNIEAFLSGDNSDGRAGRDTDDVMAGDNASEVFEPLHNVFGNQNSLEASDSAVSFEKNYNRAATQYHWQFESNLSAGCDGCDLGQSWIKDWTKVIPVYRGGYSADYVAKWLWIHVVGNLDNYTALERSQLLSILGAKRLPREDGTEPSWQVNNRFPYFDLNYLLCLRDDRLEDGVSQNSLSDLMAYDSWDDYCRRSSGEYSQTEQDAFNLTFTGDELTNSNQDPYPYLRGLVSELAAVDIGLTDTDPIEKRRANERIHTALAFIFATPFVFAEGQ